MNLDSDLLDAYSQAVVHAVREALLAVTRRTEELEIPVTPAESPRTSA